VDNVIPWTMTFGRPNCDSAKRDEALHPVTKATRWPEFRKF
jgi:hypothetical protein